jgi:two-component system OmpR family response regulator
VGHRVVTSALIVDDDEQLRRAVARVLATYDFDCRAVGTVHDAIAAAAEEGPDIVLLDVALGAASGLDILKAIRDTDSRLPAVIAAATGTAETLATNVP